MSTTLEAPLTYERLKEQLLSRPGPVLPPAPSGPIKSLAHAISSLLLHPSLEAALHLLNDDLPSAHFLVRHMQASPQYEAMLLHGILHRIEGDYDNARAWYSDVRDSDVFKAAWNHGGPERAMEFLREIEVLRKETKHPDPKSVQRLEQESLTEFKNVIEFCEKRFGTKGVEDASSIWVQSEKSSGKGSEMVVGGEGWRQF